MKTETFPKKLIKVALVLTTLVILTVCVLYTIQVISIPGDVLREDITLEEAQSLVTFSICIPTYIPTGIDPNPQIIYAADAANVPEETYIRLRYKRLDNQEKVMEIYQRYTPDAEMKTEYPDLESFRNKATIIMVWWISDPKSLSRSETDNAVERTQLEANVFQTDQTVWWLYEITDPIEYRSTMTKWIEDHVEYRILSYLPAEEIEKVTLSMLECSNP